MKWSHYIVFLHAALELTANSETYRDWLLISTKEVLQKLEPKNHSSSNINELYSLTSNRKLLYAGLIKIKI